MLRIHICLLLLFLLYITVATAAGVVAAFIAPSSLPKTIRAWQLLQRSSSCLFSTPRPQQQRQPRRNLKKKRRRKERRGNSVTLLTSGGGGGLQSADDEDDFPWDTAESRSLISSSAKELGEDYWIDPEELRIAQEREARRQRQRFDPGQIPQEKLWMEVLSPYRQNWIGLISVSIIALAFIFKNFPEVINPPMIANVPDVL